MSVYLGAKKDQIKVLDKEYGKSLNKDNVRDFVDVFFDKEDKSTTSEIVKGVVLARLRGIQAMYSGQQIFHIFGSSILFVYDASVFHEQEPSIKAIESSVVVKMIDFAHVHPAHGKIDHNYNFGLANLISVLEGVLWSLYTLLSLLVMNYLVVLYIISWNMFATNEQNRSKHILLKVILGMDLRVNPVQFPQNSMKYLF